MTGWRTTNDGLDSWSLICSSSAGRLTMYIVGGLCFGRFRLCIVLV